MSEGACETARLRLIKVQEVIWLLVLVESVYASAAAGIAVQGNLSYALTTLLPHYFNLIGGKQASWQLIQEARAPVDFTLHSHLLFPSRTGWGFGEKQLELEKLSALDD